jgi:hypothetical protein
MPIGSGYTWYNNTRLTISLIHAANKNTAHMIPILISRNDRLY